jgi:hypothetical protein
LEAIDKLEHLSAKRHVSAQQVPDRGARGRHAEVIAAHDPEELFRHPPGARGLPVRQRQSADSGDRRVLKRVVDELQPVSVRRRVIIEERDELASRPRQAGIAGARQSFGISVLHHGHVGHRGHESLVKTAVVVDDHDDFSARQALLADRLHRSTYLIPAILGIDTDHN